QTESIVTTTELNNCGQVDYFNLFHVLTYIGNVY
ncbi:MAG: hypothetical protein ACI9RU_002896, partial [Litorivivens sp.]